MLSGLFHIILEAPRFLWRLNKLLTCALITWHNWGPPDATSCGCIKKTCQHCGWEDTVTFCSGFCAR